MPPRRNTTIDMLIAQALEKKRELKELQFFGGDALNLGRWAQIINVPNDGVRHCWRVIVTPTDPKTTLPFMAEAKSATATSLLSGQVEAVHRTDGKYEYLIVVQHNAETPLPLRVTIEYTGTATFSITQLG